MPHRKLQAGGWFGWPLAARVDDSSNQRQQGVDDGASSGSGSSTSPPRKRRGWFSWITISRSPLGRRSGDQAAWRTPTNGTRAPTRPRALCREDFPMIPPGWRSSRKVLALTFDDGPQAEGMEAVLDVLRAQKVKATFFVNTYMQGGFGGGFWAPHEQAALKRLLREGHELGSHAAIHLELNRLPKAEIDHQIEWAVGNITSVTGRKLVPLFRAPYGSGFATGPALHFLADEQTKHLWAATRRHHVHVHWNFNAEDFRLVEGNPNCAEDLFQKYGPPLVRGGHTGVVLMHSTTNAMGGCSQALSRLIDYWRAQGYEFVPVSDLVKEIYGMSPAAVVKAMNACPANGATQ